MESKYDMTHLLKAVFGCIRQPISPSLFHHDDSGEGGLA